MSGKYFTGDQKLSKKLIGRTKEALRQRNVQFAQTHGDASDEELLDYVRGEAARLGMTPNAGEIIGPLYRGSLWLLEECGHGGGAGPAEEAEAPPQAADLQGGAPLSGERAGIHRATEQQRVILMKKGVPFFRHRGLPL